MIRQETQDLVVVDWHPIDDVPVFAGCRQIPSAVGSQCADSAGTRECEPRLLVGAGGFFFVCNESSADLRGGVKIVLPAGGAIPPSCNMLEQWRTTMDPRFGRR